MTVAAAFAFVAVMGVTAVVAVFTRSWELGLDWKSVAVVFGVGIAVLGGWVSLLGMGLLRGRRWAKWAMLVTFLLAAVATGAALWDTADRTLVNPTTTPVGHLVLPALLFVSAASVVTLVIRDLVTRVDDH
ncbi:MAG: hypothetical protein M3P53_00775 [Actinomycetota bacterium]|nr:hypothetical protein [Actinomycetota bacterium]